MVPLDLHASRRGAARVLPLRFAAGRGAPPPRRGSRILFRAFNSRVGPRAMHAACVHAARFFFCFLLTPRRPPRLRLMQLQVLRRRAQLRGHAAPSQLPRLRRHGRSLHRVDRVAVPVGNAVSLGCCRHAPACPCAPLPLICAFRVEQLSLPRRWQQLPSQVCLLRSLRAAHALCLRFRRMADVFVGWDGRK